MRNSRVFMVMALVAAIALTGSSLALAENYKGFARGESLITVQELKEMIDKKDPNLVLIAVEKGASFKTGHIPGAVNVWRPAYEPKVGNPYPFDGMMINRAEFQAFARKLGVNNDSKVVIYDTKYDATRLWWGFFLYGKEDVRVLDGGYYAWKGAGYDTDTALLGGKDVKEGNFVANPRRNGWVASMDDVWRAKTSDQIQVWDTREPNEWDGSTKKGNAKRAGRIPWAEFQSWKEFRTKIDDKPTGFKTAAEIQKVIDKFKMDEGKNQIFYCQSGVRTTTGIFVLYLMGWNPDLLHNYDGSWLEWSFHEGNPIASGK